MRSNGPAPTSGCRVPAASCTPYRYGGYSRSFNPGGAMFHVPPVRTTPPPVPAAHIRRPALEADLDRGADRELTLVCAPPGSGKTSLLSAWVRASSGPPTAWVRLEPEDSDPRRLWSAVLAALTRLPTLPASSRL